MRVLAGILVWAALALPAAPAWAGDAAPSVREAWSRATPPGASVGAAYLTLVGGERAARVVGARSARATRIEIHTTSEHEGMLGMRAVAVVDVPAHTPVAFAPMGTHLMLMGLATPLRAGERVPLTLLFADGSAVSFEATVRAADALPGDRGHH